MERTQSEEGEAVNKGEARPAVRHCGPAVETLGVHKKSGISLTAGVAEQRYGNFKAKRTTEVSAIWEGESVYYLLGGR